MILVLSEHPAGVEVESGNRVVYDLERNEAHFGTAHVAGPAIVWELVANPGPGELLLRCDRVDFPPGGVAHRHVHPGPGIRRILYGELTIDPRLPRRYDRLEFPLRFHDRQIRVVLSHDEEEYELVEGEPLDVTIRGEAHRLVPGATLRLSPTSRDAGST